MPIVRQLSAWGTYYRHLYFCDCPIIGTMCDFVCNSMIACWFFCEIFLGGAVLGYLHFTEVLQR